MPSLAVVYCGGCNTAYDRVELVSSIVDEIERQPGVELTRVAADQPADMRLVIAGCQTMCVYDRLDQAAYKIGHIIGPDSLDFSPLSHAQIVIKLAEEFRGLQSPA